MVLVSEWSVTELSFEAQVNTMLSAISITATIAGLGTVDLGMGVGR